MPANATLYGVPGSGAMIVEAAFALAMIEINHCDLSWDDVGWESKVLKPINPLGQIPTLVFDDGTVMTETAAILQYVHDEQPQVGLIVSNDHPKRREFLRWFAFLNAAVYPTFTYGDVPKRWVADDQGGKQLLESTDAHRIQLMKYLEGFIGTPWFLGETFSALDLYLWKMRWWRPGKEWYAENCPKLFAIGEHADAIPEIQQTAARNFPEENVPG